MRCRRRCWRMCVRFSELEGARIGVWGAGREITSFAGQLARRLPSAQIVVAAFDGQPPADVLDTLRSPSARIVTGPAVPGALAQCELVVRSPGVSIHRPEMVALGEAGVPVTTATALWLAERGGAGVIGVTGTKGKSTTAALVFHLARAAGRTAQLAGNIGVPALDLLDAQQAEVTVVELSSFHIADLQTGPQVALVTNLFPEHADWHGSPEVYRAEKLRILGLGGVRVAVLNGRDEQLMALRPASETRLFGVPDGWDVLDGGVALKGELAATSAELPLRGVHNALNLCGALTALEAFGIAPPSLPWALSDFQPLAHRLESVFERDGVLWVNDSISTTPQSTLAALAAFADREIVLIAGGQDRGQDYGQLAAAVVARGTTLIGIPSTGARLVTAAQEAGAQPSHAIAAADLQEAVTLARTLMRAGTVVLLSPAAPSYDCYRDFEQRGTRFRELIIGV